MKTLALLLIVLGSACNIASAVDFSEEFEKGMEGWVPIDEPPELLNDKGPSNWAVQPGPFSGKALNQSSNIWGDVPDVIALGTFIIYDLLEFKDFELTVDTLANDNDGMGLVWGWKSRTDHYRFFTMIDPGNPAGAQGGKNDPGKAPWSMIEKRIGDKHPYYNTLAQVKEAAYVQGTPTTFKLFVKDGNFKVYSNDKLMVEAKDPSYTGGKIGFTLYAQSGCFFDNIECISLSVDPKSKLAGTWGALKASAHD